MRAPHTHHPLPSFPVYSAAFLSPDELVLGGGGGASRSGIKNKLRLYHVGMDRSMKLVDELELAQDEDAPMSMAADLESKSVICGVNSPPGMLDKGLNKNCRVFSVKDGKLDLVATQGTLNVGNTEDYQKVTVLSPDGNFLLVAGNNDFSLLSFPSLASVVQSINTGSDAIYDATFSSTSLVITTKANLLVYALPKMINDDKPSSPSKSKKKGKQKAPNLPELELLRAIELPAALGGTSGSTFRAARFHPLDESILYTVTNAILLHSRAKKSGSRQAFICKWSTESWTIGKVRKVSDKGLTCFDLSPNGKLLGYGTSDYTIGVLDAVTLNPLVQILKAHEFPLTIVKFNPTSMLLVSGSADNSVRLVSLPDSLAGSSWGFILFLVAILSLLLAFILQKYLMSEAF